MALIVKSAGWHEDVERGEPREFRIVLVAETEGDVPKLPAFVVWRKMPVTLTLSTPAEKDD